MYNYVKEDYSIIQSDYELDLRKVADEYIEKAWDGSLWLTGHVPEPTYDQVRVMRQQAFTLEADPLRYDYEEDSARYGADSEEAIASKEIWLAKKDEIRERYPYPDKEEEE